MAKEMCPRLDNGCPLRGDGCEKDAIENCDLFWFIKQRLIEFREKIKSTIGTRPFSYKEDWYASFISELKRLKVDLNEIKGVEDKAVEDFFKNRGV